MDYLKNAHRADSILQYCIETGREAVVSEIYRYHDQYRSGTGELGIILASDVRRHQTAKCTDIIWRQRDYDMLLVLNPRNRFNYLSQTINDARSRSGNRISNEYTMYVPSTMTFNNSHNDN
jgi:hypothetical protein